MNNTSDDTCRLMQSIYLLNQQLTWNILVFLVAAPMAFMGNVFILYQLYKGRNTFKSHHYKLLAHMAFGSSLLCLYSFVFIGLKRLYMTVAYKGEVMSTFTCGMWLMPHELFLGVDSFNVMVVAMDRFIAVAFPIRYKNFNLQSYYKFFTLSISWIFSLTNIVFKQALYTTDFANSILVICILASTRPKEQSAFVSVLNLSVSISIVILYLCGISVAMYKILRGTKSSSKMKKELGFRLIITSGTDGIINCCTFFAGAIFVKVLVSKAPIASQIIFGPVSYGFYLLSLTARPMVMCCLNTEFRKVVRSKFSTTQIKTLTVGTRTSIVKETIA